MTDINTGKVVYVDVEDGVATLEYTNTTNWNEVPELKNEAVKPNNHTTRNTRTRIHAK